ncbi:helix-hairpin-helix domain-containing protein [Candidatus Daviesbacteria bacterium]|nr:helix-hairpin-helix domain-containing protein [Candidatus Daviesbacteria bacterium]
MENRNWREKIDKFKLPIGLSLVGIVLIIGGIFASGLNKGQAGPSASSRQVFPKESLVETQKTISVDVSGAVIKPGVYKLNDGSRVEDAIKEAGGFAASVNTEFVSKYLNMAQKVSDGSKIYVPAAGENTVSSQNGAVAGITAGGGVSVQAKVNINTATQAELEALPGIGPVTASKIISDRPYQGIEDLLNKKIINKSVFEKIRDQLVLY